MEKRFPVGAICICVWEGVGMKVLQIGRFDVQFFHNLPNKKA